MRLEGLLERLQCVAQTFGGVVGELLRLRDCVEDALVLEPQELDELALEAANVSNGDVVELTRGACPDRDDLVLDRER